MTATHLTDAQMLAAIADIQARHTVHATDPGGLGEEPGERDNELSPWSCDRAAEAAENAQERQWRWFE